MANKYQRKIFNFLGFLCHRVCYFLMNRPSSRFRHGSFYMLKESSLCTSFVSSSMNPRQIALNPKTVSRLRFILFHLLQVLEGVLSLLLLLLFLSNVLSNVVFFFFGNEHSFYSKLNFLLWLKHKHRWSLDCYMCLLSWLRASPIYITDTQYMKWHTPASQSETSVLPGQCNFVISSYLITCDWYFTAHALFLSICIS